LQSNAEEQSTTFEDLGLSDGLLKAVADAGYKVPTPIQEQSIPLVLLGRDVLGCAQTGTGKTASYTLPIIDILASGTAKARMPRGLILAPTRELAQQIAESFSVYGKYHSLGHAILIGGSPMGEQEKALDRGPDVIVATPGRLLDMVGRGRLMLGGVKVLVIDEADRMLDMGFIPDVERIVGLLPRIRQTLFFSATLGPEILRLADAFLINAKQVSVAPPATIANTVRHTMVSVSPRGKAAAMRKILTDENVQSALIFCNRKKDVSELRSSLRRHGFDAGELHGDMQQFRRSETLASFKAGKVTILVCSDVAGRGLDINNVSHVFNYDVPFHPEDYVHRIGRTGRAGKEGRAIMLVTPEDSKAVAAITRLIKVDVPLIPLGGEDVSQADGDSAKASQVEKSEKPPARRTDPPKKPSVEPTKQAEPAKRREQPRRNRASEAPSRRDEPVIGMGDHMPNFLK